MGRIALTLGLAMAARFVGVFFHEMYRGWRSGWRLYRDDLPYDYERDGL